MDATFFSTITFDRADLTLQGLDDLIETLREQGYPVYEPAANHIVTAYEVSQPPLSPGDMLSAAREALLPDGLGYNCREAALLALAIRDVRDDVDLEIRSMGFDAPVWSRERPEA